MRKIDQIIRIEAEIQKHAEQKEILETEFNAIPVKIKSDWEEMPVGTGTSLLENEQKKNELEPKIIKLNISNNQLIAELDLKKKAFKGNEENLNNCNAAT